MRRALLQAQRAGEQARRTAEAAQRAANEAARKAAEEARKQAELKEKAAKEAAEKARREEEALKRKLAQEKAARQTVVVVSQKKTWWEAESYCRKTYGTSLASIQSTASNTAIGEVLLSSENKAAGGNVWIGLNRFATRYWHWSDATDARFTHWGYYQRWHYYQRRNCAAHRAGRLSNGKAIARSYADYCERKRAFVCWNRGKKPSEFAVADHVAPNLRKSVPACSFSHNKVLTYSNALKECKANKNCAGVMMHSYYAKRPHLKTRAYFLKNGPQCKRVRYLSRGQGNYLSYIKDGVALD